jgi:HD-GYP domain-containing protein (c-di-GMP phosphodiesterase class II)
MGLSEEAQVHIRRGALLHDIGKMASRTPFCSSPTN